MKRLLVMILCAICAMDAVCQERTVQNRPYIDLRKLHFGILVGLHMQDIEFENIGPQTFVDADGVSQTQTILCDADTWNPGFTVGVLAELRLSDNFSARFTPSMHFGAKHLVFRNLSVLDTHGNPTEKTQDLKNTYISFPIGIKFAAPRFNNHRPYLIGGINPMINLTGKDHDIIQLKRFDTMLEIGLGCDFYLPFFKLIPELKFCYSLSDVLDKDHIKSIEDPVTRAYANSVRSGHSKMFILTFYFE